MTGLAFVDHRVVDADPLAGTRTYEARNRGEGRAIRPPMTQSIFGSIAKRQPLNLVEPQALQLVSARAPQKPTWSSSCDVALLAILEAPLRASETAAAGFARKELELRRVLGTLSVIESRSLQSRLSYPKSVDAVAQAFQRLTGERRARLLAFIADARRRQALAMHKEYA